MWHIAGDHENRPHDSMHDIDRIGSKGRPSHGKWPLSFVFNNAPRERTMTKQRLQMRLKLGEQSFDITWPCRAIVQGDGPPLGALMLAAYQGSIDYAGETLEEAIAAAQVMLDGRFGPLLARSSFVIEQAGQAIGACIITLWKGTPLVCDIRVHPAHKNQGMGTFLLKQSANALFEQGYRDLLLYVTVGNDNAQHVYEKLGFQVEESST
jgi:ribosomal protein S18 acetylase RimI-like enzyme